MRTRYFVCLCTLHFLSAVARGADYKGEVSFNATPIPGASVTAIQNGRQYVTVTDQKGLYSFRSLTDGPCTIEIQMTGFKPVRQDVIVISNAPPIHWELPLLSLPEIRAKSESPIKANPVSLPSQTPAEENSTSPELTQDSSDSLLINGSVNNAAASSFSQSAAFGNYRSAKKGLYNGGLGLMFDNSGLDAAPFSLSGQATPKPNYNDLTVSATLGGPLRIPHVLRNGPNFFLAYEWTRNRDSTVATSLVPTEGQRLGILPTPLLDPQTGVPFPNATIPQNRISPQARNLLGLYPLPNFAENGHYNYQIPLLRPLHRDALQSRLNKSIDNRNQLYGGFAFRSVREDSPNLFRFLDSTDALGLASNVNWWHRVNERWFLNVGYQFSRFATHSTAYFENRANISGEAGILGNSQDPVNWGPPSLTFSSGIARLSDGLPAFNRNQTSRVSYAMMWNRGTHNVTFGTDFAQQEFNYSMQENPRGTFTFTGQATGNDFGDFLLGIPNASSIAFGNADKYFRASLYDTYFADDWKLTPQLTANLGLRWEYGTPITELYGRLVNLETVSGFSAVYPVLASDPVGHLTGLHYPSSLLYPDKTGFEPRIGIAWRPSSGSSLVIRAGYGVYYDTSVYQMIALQMAQQPPLSKASRVQNNLATPLTLADGFPTSALVTPNTFAVDPNFQVGYAQQWQFSIQRDFPGSLQVTASYLGIKGTRGAQEFLPNTHPPAAENPCLSCQAGFAYLTSNGNSTRQGAQLQVRRRLHNGITGILEYAFSKSIDDDSWLGGAQSASPEAPNVSAQNISGTGSSSNSASNNATGTIGSVTDQTPVSPRIAQDWHNLRGERSLSSFDQRHLLTLQVQYTTGMGLGGGTLMNGWKGALLKQWTVATAISAGTGLPQTPIYLTTVPGTGFTGTIRPNYTGAPLYTAPPGFFLNAGAYEPPSQGLWGNAGRNTITGPSQFVFNASLGRTFRVSDRLHLDLRIDARNALNHVTFADWNTTINNTQFGLPSAALPMRSMQLVLRLKF